MSMDLWSKVRKRRRDEADEARAVHAVKLAKPDSDEKETGPRADQALAFQWFESDHDPIRIRTVDGCDVIYLVQGLTVEGASTLKGLFDAIATDQWNSGISSFGHPVPRLIRWYGPKAYRFAGRNWAPHDYPSLLRQFQAALRTHCESLVGYSVPLASCLVNKYRHGNDSIAPHSDAEREFGPDPAIVSVSLGASRMFRLKRKVIRTGLDRPEMAFSLGHRSILFMGGKTQDKYVHWIPKEPNVKGVRYNLTFRPYVQ